MKTNFSKICGVLLILSLGFGGCSKSTPPSKAKPMTVKPLLKQEITVSGDKEVAMILVDMKPGAASLKHYHPGHVFGYLLEGEISIDFDDKESVTLKAGEAFYEIPNHNMIGKNSSQPGKMLVMMILDKDQPPLVPVGNQPPPQDKESMTMKPLLKQAITVSGDKEVAMMLVDIKPGPVIRKSNKSYLKPKH